MQLNGFVYLISNVASINAQMQVVSWKGREAAAQYGPSSLSFLSVLKTFAQ